MTTVGKLLDAWQSLQMKRWQRNAVNCKRPAISQPSPHTCLPGESAHKPSQAISTIAISYIYLEYHPSIDCRRSVYSHFWDSINSNIKHATVWSYMACHLHIHIYPAIYLFTCYINADLISILQRARERR